MDEIRATAETERYINSITYLKTPRSVTLDDIRNETNKDPELQTIIRLLTEKKGADKLPKHMLCYKEIFNELNTTRDGIVLRGQNILIPTTLRNKIADLAHSGHQGIVKTKRLIRSRVWYPGIDKQIEMKVRNCQECQLIYAKRQYEPLQPSKMPMGSWQKVSADFFGPMPDGNYWFVNSCDYSKWLDITRIKSTSFDSIEPVLNKLFNKMGIPLEYKTDNGPPFQSHDFEEFAKEKGFKHRLITPYWPRANATAENVMRKLKRVLKIAKLEDRSPDVVLDEFLATYHDTPHTATGVAPNMLMFGYARTSGLPIVENQNKRVNIHRLAKQHHKEYEIRMKRQYDQQMKAKECLFRIGDQVLCKRNITSKSDPDWDPNPFVIIGIKGSMIEVSRTYPKKSIMVRNSSFFKIYWDYEEEEEKNVVQQDTHLQSEEEEVVQQDTALQREEDEMVQQETSPRNTVEIARTNNDLAQERAGTTSEPSVIKRGRGRPSKAESQAIAKEAREKQAIKDKENPPTRISSRLTNKRTTSQ
jgi:transposase InsO family protein